MAGLNTEELREQLNWYSTTVSASVRTTAFGVIAALWAIFTADDLSLTEVTIFGISTSTAVKLAFIFASSTLLADILQYVSSYWMYNIGMNKHEASDVVENKKEFYYNSECLGKLGISLYNVSFYLFPAKLLLVVLSASSFLLLAFSVTWSP
jgi:hypothetical protein